MKHVLFLLIALLVSTPAFTSHSLGQSIIIPITAHNGTTSIVDTFGYHYQATYCIDGQVEWGVVEGELPPWSASWFDSRFIEHRSASGCLGVGVRTHIQEYWKLDTFRLQFQPGDVGYPVTFTWPQGLDSLFEFLGIGYPGGFLGTVDMLADTAYAVTDPRITLLDIIGKVKTYSGGEFRVPLWFTDSVTSDFNPPTLRIGLHPDATPCTDDSLGEYPAITECGLFSQHCAHFEPPKDTMCGEGNYPAFLDLRYLSGTTQIDTYRVSFVGTPPVVLHWPPNLASWYDSCRLLDRPSMFFGLPPKIDVDMLAMDSVVVSGIPPPFQGDLIIRAVGPRVVTAVNELGGILPLQLSLSQNYPNPFNPSTRITFRLTSSSMVSVKIYDVLGQAITTLTNERLGAGEHTVEWHAGGLPGGVYIYRLVAGQYVETRKMVLVK